MYRLMNCWRQLPIALLVFSFTGCVSIKPSTVELSAQVGQRISEMEKIHQLALQKYFEMEEKRIEDFLTNTWEPLFLKNFLGTSGILDMLQRTASIDERNRGILREAIALYLSDTAEAERAANEIAAQLTASRKNEPDLIKTILVRYVEDTKLERAVIHTVAMLGSDEPARIILEFAEAAHQEMLAQRKEMLAPLRQANAEAVASLSESYSELIRGQATITGRLEAAAKRSKQQDELLGKLGVQPISQQLADKMSSISGKVSSALIKAQDIVDQKKEGASMDIVDTIKKVLNN